MFFTFTTAMGACAVKKFAVNINRQDVRKFFPAELIFINVAILIVIKVIGLESRSQSLTKS